MKTEQIGDNSEWDVNGPFRACGGKKIKQGMWE